MPNGIDVYGTPWQVLGAAHSAPPMIWWLERSLPENAPSNVNTEAADAVPPPAHSAATNTGGPSHVAVLRIRIPRKPELQTIGGA